MNNKTKKMNSSSSGSGMIPEKRWILVGDEEEEEIIVSSSPRKRWKVNEEMALLNGIKKHGAGRWKTILNDQQFSPFLLHRSNVSLKDKWRNLTRLNKSSRYVPPQSSAKKKTHPRHKAPRDKSNGLDGVGNSKNENGNSEKINSVGQSSRGDNQKKHNKKRLEDYASFAACMIKEAGNVTREAAEACKGIENLKKIAEEIKELVKLAD